MRMQVLLADLQVAAEALDRARRIEPDPGLDHAVERLRLMIGQRALRLDALTDEGLTQDDTPAPPLIASSGRPAE